MQDIHATPCKTMNLASVLHRRKKRFYFKLVFFLLFELFYEKRFTNVTQNSGLMIFCIVRNSNPSILLQLYCNYHSEH